MSALDRKLWRDLRRLWAQALAIALVMACGIMMLVGMQMTARTLDGTRAAFYERHRFADVFVSATRAPESLLGALTAIPGVMAAEGRIAFQAVLDLDGRSEPVAARVVSLPADGAILNVPLVRRGRLPDPLSSDEVALSEPFAEANGLVPGSRFRAILNGRLRALTVTGWVLSPEFI